MVFERIYNDEVHRQRRENQKRFAKTKKGRALSKRYYLKHKEKIKTQTHLRRLRQWGTKTEGKFDQKWKIVQNHIAPIILQKEGFKDLFQLTGYNYGFPFDWLAKRNNRIYAIEVTCGINKRVKKSQTKLSEYANWVYTLLFISPDFDKYRIMVFDEPPNKISLSISSIHPSKIKRFNLKNEEAMFI